LEHSKYLNMEYEILNTEITDGIALVTISRPKAMNALNTKFFNEMDQLVAELSSNDLVRVMVITGDGKAFVAGADIAEMVNKNSAEGSEFSRLGQKTFSSFGKMSIPVIAAINGFALGGGLELAMGCDFRIASSKAKFGQPEVNLGLIPGYAGTQRLSRLTGIGDALYLLMTADMIGAEDALRIGLVQKVFEPDVFMDETIKVAKLIASKGPQAIRKLKMVVREGLEKSLYDGEKLEAKEFGTLFGEGKEGREGMLAFLEKRKPEW
jgi:enoyl-CoA hydratase